MAERLKRWESPRKQGRNDKGKGGSARARQLRKREQMLRQKLKNNARDKQDKSNRGREINPSLFFGQLNYIIWSQSRHNAIAFHHRVKSRSNSN